MWFSLCLFWSIIFLESFQNPADITASLNTSYPVPPTIHTTNIAVYPVVAVVGISPLLVLISWCCHKKKCFRKKRNTSEDKSWTNEGFNPENEVKNEKRDYFTCEVPKFKPFSKSNNYEIPRQKLTILEVIGEGFFGKVLKADVFELKLPGEHQIVAVKTLKDNAPDCDKKDFIMEIKIMMKLSAHPHVVTFFGCCTETDPLYLIMEYVPNGRLQDYLRKCRQSQYYKPYSDKIDDVILTAKDLISFSQQIAQGMRYITSKDVLHKDLATRNVLVGVNKACKICDFGLAREAVNDIYMKTTSGPLPVRWMAPESLRDFIFTPETEVWSFGILMWEILTFGSTPYADVPTSMVMQQVQEGHRLCKPAHCKRELYNLMFYCWATDPKQRPTFRELETTLKNMLLAEINYVELEKFQDELYYNLTNIKGEKL